jgi:YjbR
MTPETFRNLALQLPGASEGEHHGHADFRVGGKIFAALGYPSVEFATILLTPEAQASFVQAEPASFVPVPGGWLGAERKHECAAEIERSARRETGTSRGVEAKGFEATRGAMHRVNPRRYGFETQSALRRLRSPPQFWRTRNGTVHCAM